MLVLIVLLATWLVFRAIGADGVHALASWQHSALYALAVMFVFTATAHFNKMKHDLAKMIPSSFPRPLLIVYIRGVLELLGAAGLVLQQFRRLAGICLIALLAGMFIANINAAQRGVTLRGKPPTRFGLRCRFCLLRYSGGQLASKRHYATSGRLEELLDLPEHLLGGKAILFTLVGWPPARNTDCRELQTTWWTIKDAESPSIFPPPRKNDGLNLG